MTDEIEHIDASRVLVFLPTYNDHAALPDLIRRIRRLGEGFVVLVVDDGSIQPVAPSDNTYLVRLPGNFGLGVATHVAFDFALSRGFAGVVRVDADGQHPPEQIIDLVRPILSGEADLVVGERMNAGSSGLRGIAARVPKAYFSMVCRLVTRGKSPRDVNSGFLAFGPEAVGRLNQFVLERFPEPQIILLSASQGLSMKPMSVKQADRADGISTIGMGQAMRMVYRFTVLVVTYLIGGRPWRSS